MTWWKISAVLLLLYVFAAGLMVPLKPGIDRVEPQIVRGGDTTSLRFYGYNTFFGRAGEDEIRVWLSYDKDHALFAQDWRAINDTILEARFVVPKRLPDDAATGILDVIADQKGGGVALLPSGVTCRSAPDTLGDAAASLWTANPVEGLHTLRTFSFPYQNVIYETIRNTYYHVPMWFALMFLFMASVWYSVKYLRNPDDEYDRRACAFAEVGFLYGIVGLLTGMLWANYTWGKPWSNDIKQIMTAVALLIYAAYFILRGSFSDSEKSARFSAAYNIFAFASLIPLLYIVPRMFASLHPGATGNPAFGSQDLDNTMRLVFYPAILGWTLLGFWIAQLRYRLARVAMRDDA